MRRLSWAAAASQEPETYALKDAAYAGRWPFAVADGLGGHTLSAWTTLTATCSPAAAPRWLTSANPARPASQWSTPPDHRGHMMSNLVAGCAGLAPGRQPDLSARHGLAESAADGHYLLRSGGLSLAVDDRPH